MTADEAYSEYIKLINETLVDIYSNIKHQAINGYTYLEINQGTYLFKIILNNERIVSEELKNKGYKVSFHCWIGTPRFKISWEKD